MNWKEILKKLEQTKQWDAAIDFMEQVLHDHPDDMDAYLFMCYLLMNYLVEEEHVELAHTFADLEELCKKYFNESYEKFSDNTEYLYYMGWIGCMSPWYIDVESKDAQAMTDKASLLEPNNLVYQWHHYGRLARQDITNPEVVAYAKLVLQEDSPIKKALQLKGSLGEWILGMMTYWSHNVIEGKRLHI